MIRRQTLRCARALAGFLRGFLGLTGTAGASDPAAARRALAERAARRRSCC
jgi:hypothetical protein